MLLAKWQIDRVPNQYEFYDRHVQPRLDEGREPAGLRHHQRCLPLRSRPGTHPELNGKYRFEATLTSQLGVLPSYTALGMASLLPHKTLAYKPNGEVLVDGKPTHRWPSATTSWRRSEGMACKGDELMAMKKDEGREFVKDKRVVYIYHNTVDAVGRRRQRPKGKTFEAVRKAIDELAALVGYIINNLNGNHVVITADHGFLFTETAPSETDKSKLGGQAGRHGDGQEAVSPGPQAARSRSGLARQDERRRPGPRATWSSGFRRVRTASTSSGGARFVHGGAMLQEIVVPVITVRHVKGKSAEDTKTKPVDGPGAGREPPDHDAQPPLRVDPDGAGQRPGEADHAEGGRLRGRRAVTNIETVTFDSASGQHGRAEEVGQPRPAGPAVRQEDTLPPGAAGRRDRHRAAERGGDHRQGVHR